MKEPAVREMLAKREPIVEKCYTTVDGEVIKCSRSQDDFCTAFISPAAKWRLGDCPLADDFLKSTKTEKPSIKVRVGQQKQKKK